MKLFIGSDHAGFELKEKLKKFLEDQKTNDVLEYDFEDLGPSKVDPKDDYPDIVDKVAKKVKKAKGNYGILICANGIGVCMAANKYKGIRAGIGYNTLAAKTMRTDDNTNVLCLAGKVLSPEYARAIMRIWLETPFSGEPRHKKRIEKVEALEADWAGK